MLFRVNISGLWYLLGALLVVLLDYASKRWALTGLDAEATRSIMPGLDLVLVFNQGAAFGILANAGGWQRWFFVLVGLVISAFVVIKLLHPRRTGTVFSVGLMFILGGALGNIIDRVRQGYVVDFIDVHWVAWHWPAFNFADVGISVGAVILVADALGVFPSR